MKHYADITVQSLETTYAARGVIEALEDGVRIVYQEPESLEMGEVTTTLTVRGGAAVLSRDGAVRCALRFEEGKVHRSVYETIYGTFPTELRTHALRAQLDARGGLLDLCYMLAIGGASDEHRLKILVRAKEEIK
ncbi:MAG: DUF1934 domain-containing protein [Ruminococcaceae bacterium]|nr:DUF1934 domain-containing protein [Oscillospiraceae bacterium]